MQVVFLVMLETGFVLTLEVFLLHPSCLTLLQKSGPFHPQWMPCNWILFKSAHAISFLYRKRMASLVLSYLKERCAAWCCSWGKEWPRRRERQRTKAELDMFTLQLSCLGFSCDVRKASQALFCFRSFWPTIQISTDMDTSFFLNYETLGPSGLWSRKSQESCKGVKVRIYWI